MRERLLKFITHRISLVWCLEVSQWSTNYDLVGRWKLCYDFPYAGDCFEASCKQSILVK